MDGGLNLEGGHNPITCERITSELHSRGIETVVLGNRHSVSPRLKKNLSIRPFFSCYTFYPEFSPYPDGRIDKFCGWLQSFDMAWQLTLKDLNQIEAVGHDDVVFFNTVFPFQVKAVQMWVAGLPVESRPTVIFELGSPLLINFAGGEITALADPGMDSLPFLHRYVAGQAGQFPGLFYSTFSQSSSVIHEALLRTPVRTLPAPQTAVTSATRRTGKRPVTISVVGAQCARKGYHFVPEIVAQLAPQFMADCSANFVIQNSGPNMFAEAQEIVRTLPHHFRNVKVIEALTVGDDWAQLLGRSDLILCPYDAQQYFSSYSAVAYEAIANAIPVVVPAHTTLSATLEQFGNPGVQFTEFSPVAIAAAVKELIHSFDLYAERAHKASQLWARSMGPKPLVGSLLQLSNETRGRSAA